MKSIGRLLLQRTTATQKLGNIVASASSGRSSSSKKQNLGEKVGKLVAKLWRGGNDTTERLIREIVQEVEGAVLRSEDPSVSILSAIVTLHRIALSGPIEAGHSASIRACLHFLGETASIKLEDGEDSDRKKYQLASQYCALLRERSELLRKYSNLVDPDWTFATFRTWFHDNGGWSMDGCRRCSRHGDNHNQSQSGSKFELGDRDRQFSFLAEMDGRNKRSLAHHFFSVWFGPRRCGVNLPLFQEDVHDEQRPILEEESQDDKIKALPPVVPTTTYTFFKSISQYSTALGLLFSRLTGCLDSWTVNKKWGEYLTEMVSVLLLEGRCLIRLIVATYACAIISETIPMPNQEKFHKFVWTYPLDLARDKNSNDNINNNNITDDELSIWIHIQRQSHRIRSQIMNAFNTGSDYIESTNVNSNLICPCGYFRLGGEIHLVRLARDLFAKNISHFYYKDSQFGYDLNSPSAAYVALAKLDIATAQGSFKRLSDLNEQYCASIEPLIQTFKGLIRCSQDRGFNQTPFELRTVPHRKIESEDGRNSSTRTAMGLTIQKPAGIINCSKVKLLLSQENSQMPIISINDCRDVPSLQIMSSNSTNGSNRSINSKKTTVTKPTKSRKRSSSVMSQSQKISERPLDARAKEDSVGRFRHLIVSPEVCFDNKTLVSLATSLNDFILAVRQVQITLIRCQRNYLETRRTKRRPSIVNALITSQFQPDYKDKENVSTSKVKSNLSLSSTPPPPSTGNRLETSTAGGGGGVWTLSTLTSLNGSRYNSGRRAFSVISPKEVKSTLPVAPTACIGTSQIKSISTITTRVNGNRCVTNGFLKSDGVCRTVSVPSELSRNRLPAYYTHGGGGVPDRCASTCSGYKIISTKRLPSMNYLIDAKELKLETRVGYGATAQVYKGHWKGTEVAIKIFRQDVIWRIPSFISQRGNNSLNHEAEIVLKIRHPNLVLVMGLVDNLSVSMRGQTDKGTISITHRTATDQQQYSHHQTTNKSQTPPAIVSEFCSGGTLFSLLHRKKTSSRSGGKSVRKPSLFALTWQQRFKIALDIAKGCNYLHSFKPPIIHRDLKSLNILLHTPLKHLDDVPLVKISDFGMSMMFDVADYVRGQQSSFNASSHATPLAGTFHWMAPEIVLGQPQSEKVDIFSFGIVLYEILSSHVPYGELKHLEPKQIAQMVALQQHRPDLSKLPPDCPNDLRNLMIECWNHCPLYRPSFEHIIRRLEKNIQAPRLGSPPG